MEIAFYHSSSGKDYVKEFIVDQRRQPKAIEAIYRQLERVEKCVIRKTVCHLLHGFIKKSNHTPLKEIKTALNRAKDLDYKLSLAVS